MVRFDKAVKAIYKWNFKEYVIEESIEKVRERIENIPQKTTFFSSNNIELITIKGNDFEVGCIGFKNYPSEMKRVKGSLTWISENKTKVSLASPKSYWKFLISGFMVLVLIVEFVRVMGKHSSLTEVLFSLFAPFLAIYMLGSLNIITYRTIEDDLEKYLCTNK